MHEQSLLALPSTTAARWMEHALLDERTVTALAGLNGDFLTLAGGLSAARPGLPVLGLPGHLAARLARAATETGPRLRLPYALFDLRFRDARFWQSQALAAAAVRDGHDAGTPDSVTLAFARTALTFAWHLVQWDGGAARLALGLEGGTVTALGALPVGSLDGLARRTAATLAARFCTRERFWELLLHEDGGPRAAPERLERLSLLGQQLQGMDAARSRQLHRRALRSTQA